MRPRNTRFTEMLSESIKSPGIDGEISMAEVKNLRNVSVIGSGMMGHGIAQIFATQGYNVTMQDVNQNILSQSIEKIRSNLSLMAQKGIGDPSEIEPSIRRIKTTSYLEEAASEAQFLVEAVSENLELKQKIFQDLDSFCLAEVILATNTSVISITEIARKAKNRERIVGTHFWNPPYLIPLVEVTRGEETSSEVMDLTVELLRVVGKHPVRVNKDVPGFVGNRLQHALWREAISIVEKGIADAATVDEVIKNSFGIRLAVLGPLENADMAGLDLTFAIHDYILKHLEHSPDPSPLLRKKVKDGDLGFKTGQGFYPWSSEKRERIQKNLLEYLLKWTKSEKGA
jgi:3-hydroxybutyryl-CoA dehydrogenase